MLFMIIYLSHITFIDASWGFGGCLQKDAKKCLDVKNWIVLSLWRQPEQWVLSSCLVSFWRLTNIKISPLLFIRRLDSIVTCRFHEFHEPCHSVTFYFMKKTDFLISAGIAFYQTWSYLVKMHFLLISEYLFFDEIKYNGMGSFMEFMISKVLLLLIPYEGFQLIYFIMRVSV